MVVKNSDDIFSPIAVKDPAELIIEQIRDHISAGILKPGERLPSEPKMVESFNVSRAIVRRALKRLDAYGIVKVIPHSGTYVAGLGVEALGGLFSNVLNLEKKDYEDLAKVRFLLESEAVRTVSSNISVEGLNELESIIKDYRNQVKKGIISLHEDLVFHIKIAENTGNNILKTLIALLTSETLTKLGELEVELGKDKLLGRLRDAVDEHQKIYEAIKQKDPEKAVKALENHYLKARQFRERATKQLIN
ncbi:MAG: FadR family transcriptional regulator [Desulfobacterales bacterium]|nr:FadR family transcriptional regulator [Desulfobacterales bacterium]